MIVIIVLMTVFFGLTFLGFLLLREGFCDMRDGNGHILPAFIVFVFGGAVIITMMVLIYIAWHNKFLWQMALF